MKQCSKCKEEKQLDKFRKNRQYPDGYCCWCKNCEKEYLQQWKKENKDKIKGYRQKGLSVHATLMRKWRKKNPDKIKQIKARYKKKNPWAIHLRYIKDRCHYKVSYSRRKVFLTTQDLKELWFRDKAFLLKRPSIDRIDNNGDYMLNNCRFIELSENSRLGAIIIHRRLAHKMTGDCYEENS